MYKLHVINHQDHIGPLTLLLELNRECETCLIN